MSDASPDNVHALPRRRTHLDACREQGVHNEREEFRAEIVEARAKQTAIRTETRKLTGRLDGKPSLSIVGHEEEPNLTEAEAALARVGVILAAYAAAGLGDAWFPMLRHLVMEPTFRAEHAEGVFAATLSDHRRAGICSNDAPELLSDAALHERRRLGLDDPRVPVDPEAGE